MASRSTSPECADGVIAYSTRPPGFFRELVRAARVLCFGFDLFLSHSHGDHAYATALWPRLEELGFTTCFDAVDFHVGQRLRMTMRRTVASSSTLLLIDTPRARQSKQIPIELAAAVSNSRPIVIIRESGLPISTWPGVDADDELLYAGESKRAFELASPSAEAIAHITRRHRAMRVQTRFRLLASGVALILAALGTYALLDRAFTNRLASVYRAMEEPSSSIEEADSRFRGLVTSWIDGFIGRTLHPTEVAALRTKLTQLNLKAIDTSPLSAGVAAADLAHRSYPTLSSEGKDFATAPAADAVATLDGRTVQWRLGGLLRTCRPLDAAGERLALSPSGSTVAVLAGPGLYLIAAERCDREEWHKTDVGSHAGAVVAFSFGDEGRSIVLAWNDRLITFGCSSSFDCTRTDDRTVERSQAFTTPNDRFCGAAISPRSRALAVLIGACGEPDRTVCAIANPIRCSGFSTVSAVTFDPSGQALATYDGELARWAIDGRLEPSDNVSGDQWGPQDGRIVRDLHRVAFDPEGGRLVTLTVERADRQTPDSFVLTVYRWPGLSLVQAIVVPAQESPSMLLVGRSIALAGTDGVRAFDMRHRDASLP